MTTLEIFFEGRPVGVCHDARLKMERGDRIDITTRDSPFPEFIPGPPTWTIEAHDVQWDGNPVHYTASSEPLSLYISEDGRPMMEGQAFIQSMRHDTHPISTRLVYDVDFVGQGMLVRTDGLRPVMDRTPLDNDSLWKFSSNDREVAIGFAISASEDVRKQKAMREQLKQDIKGYEPTKLHLDDNIIITSDPRAKDRYEDPDPTDSDETPRGFKIVP